MPDDEVMQLREQLASFRALLALSMVMTSSYDESEILRMATSAAGSFGDARTVAVHIDGGWADVENIRIPPYVDRLERQLHTLGRAGGPVTLSTEGWVWAYPLANLREPVGHVIVRSPAEPAQHHRFLIGALMQQAGTALASARLHAFERAATQELRNANHALERSNSELEASLALLRRHLEIHNRLTQVATRGGGREGIADVVNELTGYPVAIEDRHGNLLAWAGPDQPRPYPKQSPGRRAQTLRRAVTAGEPVRDRGRLILAAQPSGEIDGVIALVDPDRLAGATEQLALEYANTVLTLELAHIRSLAESELRLRRDLAEELLAGTDALSAKERARALGYDLERPHRVAMITTSRRTSTNEALYHAVRQGVRETGAPSLMTSRSSGVAVLCADEVDWEQLRTAVQAHLGNRTRCRLGVGTLCVQPADFPRSYTQAQLALKLQFSAGWPPQVTVFDNLGIYQLLSEIADVGSVESFVQQWLGALLDYDDIRHGRLVETLSQYLESGGHYDTAAKALSLHRNTLRYRLRRIRELSGFDLSDPDVRFNLQLATRAWTTSAAMRG